MRIRPTRTLRHIAPFKTPVQEQEEEHLGVAFRVLARAMTFHGMM
jgi:hypothetical protein